LAASIAALGWRWRHERRIMLSWNKGHIIGQKPPLKPSEVWSIRTRAQSGISLSSVLPSTASSGHAISSPWRLATSRSQAAWIARHRLEERDFLFPSRDRTKPHMSTRQYGRIVDRWVFSIGLDPKRYGTHSVRRTRASQIYRKTGNIRAVQLLLGHAKMESTVRYLGVDVDDALAISEQVEL
jgi:hypothetical protein